jgi:hypothetical protein
MPGCVEGSCCISRSSSYFLHARVGLMPPDPKSSSRLRPRERLRCRSPVARRPRSRLRPAVRWRPGGQDGVGAAAALSPARQVAPGRRRELNGAKSCVCRRALGLPQCVADDRARHAPAAGSGDGQRAIFRRAGAAAVYVPVQKDAWRVERLVCLSCDPFPLPRAFPPGRFYPSGPGERASRLCARRQTVCARAWPRAWLLSGACVHASALPWRCARVAWRPPPAAAHAREALPGLSLRCLSSSSLVR